jgi:hypothetical protein
MIMERELWNLLYHVVQKLDNGFGRWRYSDGDIVMVYLWAVLHDRPTSWAAVKTNWSSDLCLVHLPSQSCLSRRLRRAETQQLMTAAEEVFLVLAYTAQGWLKIIDAKPLPISCFSKDGDAGYGRGAGGYCKGYKFYAVWGAGPLPTAWGLASMNVSEKIMARSLIRDLPGGGYLMGDNEYDSNVLYDLAGEAGYQLLAPQRKSTQLGHQRHSPYRLRCIELRKGRFGREIFNYRGQIERDFGGLTSFGGGLTGLPSWVRTFPRVRNWIHGKLLINAARWFRNHPKLAVA